MFESTHGRWLAGMLVVLLGVALALPALGSRPTQCGQPTLARGDAGPAALGEPGQVDILPSAGEDEDSNTGDSLGAPRAIVEPLQVHSASSRRFEAPSNEHPRPNAGHGVLARQRGPPV